MSGNCEKMAVISSTSKEWPQNLSNENNMMVNSAHRIMEKSSSQEQQPPSLKCPRCDSSNTKFCYYNNYSLSQPRHFCKACKRYWTRGGTLRNVPVGGGCRKNKRVKRTASSSTTDGIASSSAVAAEAQSANPSILGQAINPLVFGLASNPSEMSPSVSRFSMHGNVSGYGLRGQVSNLGLGFSSGVMSIENAHESYVQDGFDSSKNIEDLFASKSVLSSYLGNSSCPTSTCLSMPSLLSSTIYQQRFINPDMKEASNNFQDIGSQIVCSNETKDVKLGGQDRVEYNLPYHNQVDQHNGLTDSSLPWNSTTNIGSWHDLANMGSSVS